MNTRVFGCMYLGESVQLAIHHCAVCRAAMERFPIVAISHFLHIKEGGGRGGGRERLAHTNAHYGFQCTWVVAMYGHCKLHVILLGRM